jgi:uncharacterized protein YndB with AHSA1/START domain
MSAVIQYGGPKELNMPSLFNYVLYVRANPNQVWEALTRMEQSRRYWFNASLESSWVPGTFWAMKAPDGRVVNSGQVLRAERPLQLVLSWRNELKAELTAEGYSQVTFDLAAMGRTTVLTLTHRIDMDASKLIADVARGWPLILSSLKTALETGSPLRETMLWPDGL